MLLAKFNVCIASWWSMIWSSRLCDQTLSDFSFVFDEDKIYANEPQTIEDLEEKFDKSPMVFPNYYNMSWKIPSKEWTMDEVHVLFHT